MDLQPGAVLMAEFERPSGVMVMLQTFLDPFFFAPDGIGDKVLFDPRSEVVLKQDSGLGCLRYFLIDFPVFFIAQDQPVVGPV